MPDVAPSPKQERLAAKTWQRHITDQRDFDRELSRILTQAANQAERIVAQGLATGSTSIRMSQLKVTISQLRQLATQMWDGEITPAMQKALDRSAQLGIDGLMEIDALLFDSVGDAALRRSLLMSAQNAANHVRSRLLNDIKLSDSVYKTKALSNGWVEQVINNGIATGASARDIAKAVRSMIDPRTPGGVSYAAQRLGRTELNNAFHTTTIRAAADQPWVEGFKWNLSDSHPRPDPCNDYAEDDHDGIGAGIFLPEHAPGKPHPQCLCYMTTITVDDEEFISRLAAGKYDDYITANGGTSVKSDVPKKSLKTPKQALMSYHEDSFSTNAKLRRGEVTPDVEVIDGIMATARTEKELRAYRVVDSKKLRDELSHADIGDYFTDKAFVSTTVDKSVLDEFYQTTAAERVIMDIKVPKGSPAVKLGDYLGDESFYYEQGELLIDRDAKFQIVDIKKTPDGLNVVMILRGTRSVPRIW